MTEAEKSELLQAILLAVNEAEDWYGDCWGLEDGQRLANLGPCYAILDANGLTTKRESP